MKYRDQRQHVRSGDVFLFRKAKGPANWLIRAWTQSPYSHAGIAIWLRCGNVYRLCVLEAVLSGVRLYPASMYLGRETIIDWYMINNWGGSVFQFKTPAVSNVAVAEYALAQLGKRYAPLVQLWISFSRSVRAVLKRPVRLDRDRWFCSELVAASLHAAGYNGPGGPVQASPGDVAKFSCLTFKGSLEL